MPFALQLKYHDTGEGCTKSDKAKKNLLVLLVVQSFFKADHLLFLFVYLFP